MDRKFWRLDGRFTPPLVRCLIVGSLFVVAPRDAMAQVRTFPNTPDAQSTLQILRAKAAADECFAYLALPAPLPKFTNPADCSVYATDPPAKKKVNQSYIWGITTSGASIWFGTFANGQCITQAGVAPPNPYQTDAWVCEFGNSPYVPSPFPDGRIGDARPPRAYMYKQSSGKPGQPSTLTDKTPRYPVYVTANNPEGIVPLLGATRGIRSAATFGDIILLAGPNLNPAGGLAFFAWNKNTGVYLGARPALGYNNIRQFLTVNGGLYSAVGKNSCPTPTTCTAPVTAGRIVRLNPTIVTGCVFTPTVAVPNPPPCFLLNGGTQAAPLPMTEVGNLNTTGGSLTAHNGRIFTVTWPSVDLPGVLSSLYMSPIVPATGLTAANAPQWTQLWKADDYEPDPFIAQTYAGGALASFDGYLFWGTLHIPMQPFLVLSGVYPPATQEELFQDLAGTFRSTVLFRGKNLDTGTPEIDLLYGNDRLPVFTPPGGSEPRWALQPNNTGGNALWGPAGLGNPWNTYTWSSTVHDNRLWIGTMDWSFTAEQGAELINDMGGSLPEELFSSANHGADLFYFTSANKPAFPESTNGVGNPTTYGIRNQVVGGNLFLGMANAMNLLTEPDDLAAFGGLGGWELDELAPKMNTPAGSNVTVNLPNGVSVTYCSVSTLGNTVSANVSNPFDLNMPITPLLVPNDLNGPGLFPGISEPPSQLVLLWSSRWGKGWEGCADPDPTVRVPLPSGASTTPRLLQLQWDGTQFTWQEITTSVDWSAGKILGKITPGYLGVLAVAR